MLAPQHPNYVPVGRDLIMLFGSQIEAAEDVNVPLESAQLWQLRELIPIGLRDSYGRNIGLNIKKKVYAALQSIADERVSVEFHFVIGIPDATCQSAAEDRAEDTADS
jgi:hypothetical protein